MVLVIGQVYHITRTVIDVDTVRIRLSRNNGASWEVISASETVTHVTTGEQEVYSTFDYAWTVTGGESTQCLFEIAGTGENADIVDISDVPFTIQGLCIIDVQPLSVKRYVGRRAVFTCEYRGATTDRQWHYNDGSGWKNVGSSENVYITDILTIAFYNGLQLRYRITNSYGAVTSNVVTLTVTNKKNVVIITSNFINI
jgi:hypothetical protein